MTVDQRRRTLPSLQPPASSLKNVLARNRTWSSTFAESRAFRHTPRTEESRAESPESRARITIDVACVSGSRLSALDSWLFKQPTEESNPVLQNRNLPCDPAHSQAVLSVAVSTNPFSIPKFIQGDRAESNRRQTDSQSVSGNQHRTRPQRKERESNPQGTLVRTRPASNRFPSPIGWPFHFVIS